MSNVLDQTTQQQVITLRRLGWSLRRIEAATGVRRETIPVSLMITPRLRGSSGSSRELSDSSRNCE